MPGSPPADSAAARGRPTSCIMAAIAIWARRTRSLVTSRAIVTERMAVLTARPAASWFWFRTSVTPRNAGVRAVGEIDQALRHPLDPARQNVVARRQILEKSAHDDYRRRIGADHALVGGHRLNFEAAKTCCIGDRAKANPRRGRLVAAALFGTERHAEGFAELVELLRGHVALNEELRAAAPLEDVAELTRLFVGGTVTLEKLAGDEHRLLSKEYVDVGARSQPILDHRGVGLF